MISRREFAFATAVAWMPSARAQQPDTLHAPWTALLARHVVLQGGGTASQVRYAGFAGDRAALDAYLAALAAVPAADFDAMPKPDRMAFLINAYNAHTVALILTRYPKLRSIRDLGSLLQSP